MSRTKRDVVGGELPMDGEWRRWWRLFVIEGVVVLLVVAGIVALNPWTANHFGYALPGADGLPFRIHYGGRDYSASGYCAGAEWCAGQQQQRTCWSQAKLMSVNIWPLAQVGEVPALFAHPYPIMNAAIPAGMTSTLIFIPVGSCYVVYELEGGP